VVRRLRLRCGPRPLRAVPRRLDGEPELRRKACGVGAASRLPLIGYSGRPRGHARKIVANQIDLICVPQLTGDEGRLAAQKADTRAAMTAGSTAVCDQQTAEGAGCRVLGECSVWGARLTCRLLPARKLLDGYAQFAQACRDCQRHRRCMRPQIPGLAPGGLGPHRTSSGSPAGFPPVSRLPAGLSPFARRPLVSLRPAFSGSVPSAAAQFRFSAGFPPGSLPWAIFTLALPRAGSAGAGPGRQGPRSPVPPRPPRLDHAIRPHCRWAAAGHDGMPPQNRLLPAAASAAHRRARTAQGGSRT
jgi:hypothetical protein